MGMQPLSFEPNLASFCSFSCAPSSLFYGCLTTIASAGDVCFVTELQFRLCASFCATECAKPYVNEHLTTSASAGNVCTLILAGRLLALVISNVRPFGSAWLEAIFSARKSENCWPAFCAKLAAPCAERR